MPTPSLKNSLHINILNPQGNPEKIYVKVMRWLLSTGRYIIIAVEIVVLGAFLSRFKLDNDLANNNEAIKQQVPFIESLKPDEQLIKQTQLQLATIKNIHQKSYDYPDILKRVAAQSPQGLTITTLNIDKSEGKAMLRISGQARSNNDLSTFLFGLKEENSFEGITLVSAGLDQNNITFSINGTVKAGVQ